jgi:hypothetical protein
VGRGRDALDGPAPLARDGAEGRAAEPREEVRVEELGQRRARGPRLARTLVGA